MNPRLFRLIETHARVDAALRREQQSRAADWSRVSELKKLKLRVKDIIHRLTAQPRLARR